VGHIELNAIPPTCREGDPHVYGRDQPQYLPLPARTVDGPEGLVITEWQLTEEERTLIAHGENIRLSVMTWGERLQPVRLDITTPEGD
jgi:hypothetical protein